jgi:hypothetical protein
MKIFDSPGFPNPARIRIVLRRKEIGRPGHVREGGFIRSRDSVKHRSGQQMELPNY